MGFSKAGPRMTTFIRVFGLILFILGLIIIYYNITSPMILDPDKTFFNSLGIAQIILGLFILTMKVKE